MITAFTVEAGKRMEVPIEQVRFLGLPVLQYSGERGTRAYLEALMEDIRQHGIREPLQVGRIDDWSTLIGEEHYKGPGKYLISDGAHRLWCAKKLKLKTVPIEVRE